MQCQIKMQSQTQNRMVRVPLTSSLLKRRYTKSRNERIKNLAFILTSLTAEERVIRRKLTFVVVLD